MPKRSNAAAALQSSTRGETSFREFANSTLALEQSKQRAAPLLNSKGLLQNVRALAPEDQTKFIDKIDQAYPTIDSQDTKAVTALGDVCSAIGQLPTSAVISAGLEKHSKIITASGGLADTWRGEYDATQVAIKAFRIYPAQNLKEAKGILWKRIPMLRRLSHENILSLRGVTMTHFQLALVYDWEKNGNISQYIASNPHTSRPSLLLDVAKGVEYLHSLDIPHGDLKGANVVIDTRGRARLTEYGLAHTNHHPTFTAAATPGAVGTSRWLAPEIVNPPRKGGNMPVWESKAADVFAFGMLAVEVFTGKIPFEEQKSEAVALCISQGGRPEIPENAPVVGLTGEMWKLLEGCWQQNPKKRPTIEEVVRRWRKFVENDDGSGGVIKPRGPLSPAAGPTPRRWAKSEAVQPPSRSKTVQSRMRSKALQPAAASDVGQQGKKSGNAQQGTRPEVVRKGTQIVYSPPTSTRRKYFCGLF